ncbi:MAG: delta-60 repeat domain-containing protein [Xanthomonadales bacterium]|nr:delta-60 repeat domain-containing protein [Xanthomonadales bacterium]
MSKWSVAWMVCASALWTSPGYANGQLDSVFAGGRTSTYWAIDADGQRGATRPVKTLVQRDDKVLVVSNTPTPFGSQFPGNSQIGITRFNSDGSVDPSYGPFGQRLLDAGEDFEVAAVDATLRRDGALLLLATLYGPFDESDMDVWAVLPNGELDPAFSNDGFLRIRRGGSPSDRAGAIVPYLIDSDRFLLVGDVRDGNVGDHGLMQVVLFANNGTLCAANDCGNVIGGDVGLPSQWRMFRANLNFDVEVAAAVAHTQMSPELAVRFRTLMRRSVVDGSGQFDGVVVGTSFPSQTNALGLDPGFGAGGFQQYLFTAASGYRHTTGNQLAVQTRAGNVRLVIAGYSADAQDLDPSMGVFAMNLITGSADVSFNGGVGKVFDYNAGGIHGDAYADDVLAMADGRLLIGGGYEYASFAFGDAALVRLNYDGSFDNGFGDLNAELPGRMGYGHSLLGGDRDNRLASMALSANSERVVFSGFAYASDDGSYYGSVMRARLYEGDLLRNGFE